MKKVKENINENKGLLEQLQFERERIQKEKRVLSNRLEELKEKAAKELRPDANSFRLDDIEKAANNSSYEIIVKKMELLEKALNQSDYVDEKFRNIVAEYINEIEPKVNDLQNKKNELIEESLEIVKQAEIKSEELKEKAALITEEIDDLIEPTGKTIFAYQGNHSGPYILNKIKNIISKYSKDR